MSDVGEAGDDEEFVQFGDELQDTDNVGGGLGRGADFTADVVAADVKREESERAGYGEEREDVPAQVFKGCKEEGGRERRHCGVVGDSW